MDTRLFVYPSLSHSLLSGLIITALGIFVFQHIQRNQANLTFSKGHGIVLLWMGYIFISQYFIPSETYRFYYILISLLFSLIISFLLRYQLLKWDYIENVILLFAVIHIFTIQIQLTGYFTHRFYVISGFSDNPSITAIYLTCSIVVVLQRIVRCKWFYGMFLVLIIAAILVLKCRTAYLGVIIISVIYLFSNYYISGNRKLLLSCIGITCTFLLFAIGMYYFKQSSSDGRLLIWKISCQMVKDNPWGYGYGMFEKYYNLYQAVYFSKGNATSQEKYVADHVFMPYNDYLEQAIEGGTIGLFLYLSFFAFMIMVAYRKQDIGVMTIAVVILLMSMLNFVYTAVPVWLLVMCVAGKVFMPEKEDLESRFPHLMPLAAISVSVLLCFRELKVINAQIQLAEWHELINQGKIIQDRRFEEVKDRIETSERFYIDRGKNCMRAELYQEAIASLTIAQEYTSTPQLYLLLHQCYQQMEQVSKGLNCLKTMENMQPHRFLPKILLMRGYNEERNNKRAMDYARKIVQMPAKVESAKVEEYKNEANNYIQLHEE